MGWGKLLLLAIVVLFILSGSGMSVTDFINKSEKLIKKAQYYIQNKKAPTLSVDVKVSDLPKAQPRYFVLVVTNVGKSTVSPDQLKLLVSTLNVPTVIAINPNDVDSTYLQSLALLSKLYSVSFGIWVPSNIATSDYNSIQNYVEKNLGEISKYIDVNVLVTNIQTLPDALKKYAVANSFYVIKGGNGNKVSPISVDGKETTTYSFSMLYYNQIDDPDVALVKSSVQDLISNHKGVLMIGFNANMITDTTQHQDVNLQKAIINPILQLENAYSLMNMKFDTYLDFYSNVIDVRLALKNKGNFNIVNNDYGSKVTITIPKMKALVTLIVPDEVGLLTTEKLQTVSVTSSSGEIPQNQVITIDQDGNKLIYLMNDYDNVVITLTYVKSSS